MVEVCYAWNCIFLCFPDLSFWPDLWHVSSLQTCPFVIRLLAESGYLTLSFLFSWGTVSEKLQPEGEGTAFPGLPLLAPGLHSLVQQPALFPDKTLQGKEHTLWCPDTGIILSVQLATSFNLFQYSCAPSIL